MPPCTVKVLKVSKEEVTYQLLEDDITCCMQVCTAGVCLGLPTHTHTHISHTVNLCCMCRQGCSLYAVAVSKAVKVKTRLECMTACRDDCVCATWQELTVCHWWPRLSLRIISAVHIICCALVLQIQRLLPECA